MQQWTEHRALRRVVCIRGSLLLTMVLLSSSPCLAISEPAVGHKDWSLSLPSRTFQTPQQFNQDAPKLVRGKPIERDRCPSGCDGVDFAARSKRNYLVRSRTLTASTTPAVDVNPMRQLPRSKMKTCSSPSCLLSAGGPSFASAASSESPTRTPSTSPPTRPVNTMTMSPSFSSTTRATPCNG